MHPKGTLILSKIIEYGVLTILIASTLFMLTEGFQIPLKAESLTLLVGLAAGVMIGMITTTVFYILLAKKPVSPVNSTKMIINEQSDQYNPPQNNPLLKIVLNSTSDTPLSSDKASSLLVPQPVAALTQSVAKTEKPLPRNVPMPNQISDAPAIASDYSTQASTQIPKTNNVIPPSKTHEEKIAKPNHSQNKVNAPPFLAQQDAQQMTLQSDNRFIVPIQLNKSPQTLHTQSLLLTTLESTKAHDLLNSRRYRYDEINQNIWAYGFETALTKAQAQFAFNTVDAVTGACTLLNQIDYDFKGLFPIQCARHYHSDNRSTGLLGIGWRFSFETFLEEEGNFVTYTTTEGRLLSIPKLQSSHQVYLQDEQCYVSKLSEHVYLIYDLHQHYYRFERLDKNNTQFKLTRIENRQGQFIHFNYAVHGSHHCIHSIQDSSGNYILLHYVNLNEQHDVQNSELRISQIQMIIAHKPAKTLVMYDYDEAGHLCAVKHTHASPTHKFIYNEQALLIEHHTAMGLKRQFSWELMHEQWHVVSYSDNNGGKYQFAYNTMRQTTTITTSKQHTASIEYNEQHVVTAYHDFDELTYHYVYDQLNQCIQIVLPHKLTASLMRDANGRIINITYTDTKITQKVQYVYFENSLHQHSRTDIKGQEWYFHYDDDGRLTQTITPLQHKNDYHYNDNDQLISHQDPNGVIHRYQRNLRHQITLLKQDDQLLYEYEYNDEGHLISCRNASGSTILYIRDQEGRITEVIHPDQNREHFIYDQAGLLVTHKDALGFVSQFSYDLIGRVIEYTDRLQRSIMYDYNIDDQITCITNQNQLSYRFTYDPVGRLLEERRPDKSSIQYSYDQHGFLTKSRQVGHNGAVKNLQFEIDTFGWLRYKSDASAEYFYDYDALGSLISARTEPTKSGKQIGVLPSSLHFDYDAEGRLLSEISDRGTLRYQYDAAGHLLSIVLPDEQKISYMRDTHGTVSSIYFNQMKIMQAQYDQYRLIQLTSGTRQIHATYDVCGHLIQQQSTIYHPISNIATSTQTTQYQYNPLGLLVQIEDSLRGIQTLEYDAEGRLIQFSGQNHLSLINFVNQFQYDPCDNLLDQSSKTGARTQTINDNRLKKYAGIGYDYDGFGNLTMRKKDHIQQEFTYDGANHLMKAKGCHQQPHETIYDYDALGRRIGKSVQWLTHDGKPDGAEETTRYLWAGLCMIQEIVKRSGKIMIYSYVYLLDGQRKLIAQVQQDLQQNEQKTATILYYHNDIFNQPIEAYDEAGNIVWSEYYQAFGASIKPITQTIYQPMRRNGQYFDEETGLHYDGLRYYDAHIGRFITQSQFGVTESINLYQYVPKTHYCVNDAIHDCGWNIPYLLAKPIPTLALPIQADVKLS